MTDTVQTLPEGPFDATPKTELERQIMDPNTPKMEREWWAASEITALRAENENLRAALHRISLGSQNSMTNKEALGKEARAALEEKS